MKTYEIMVLTNAAVVLEGYGNPELAQQINDIADSIHHGSLERKIPYNTSRSASRGAEC